MVCLYDTVGGISIKLEKAWLFYTANIRGMVGPFDPPMQNTLKYVKIHMYMVPGLYTYIHKSCNTLHTQQ